MSSGEEKEWLTLAFGSQGEWEAWLEEHHERVDEIWVKFATKSLGIPSVSMGEAQETALCYGWIDGRAASIEDAFWMMRFTPRRPKSNWSKINRERVERLLTEFRIRPAGLRVIEAAKRDGRWDA